MSKRPMPMSSATISAVIGTCVALTTMMADELEKN